MGGGGVVYGEGVLGGQLTKIFKILDEVWSPSLSIPNWSEGFVSMKSLMESLKWEEERASRALVGGFHFSSLSVFLNF